MMEILIPAAIGLVAGIFIGYMAAIGSDPR